MKSLSNSINRIDFLLACAVVQNIERIDSDDMVGLVCKKGRNYGDVGRIVSYRGGEVELVFADGFRDLFSGPQLDKLGEPSLGSYGVEPFFIGDLAQNRGFPSHLSRQKMKGIFEAMSVVGRTHVGLAQLSSQMENGRYMYGIQRVQDILEMRSGQRTRLGENEK